MKFRWPLRKWRWFNPRDGIEAGAQETRLALKLTGIIASTSDGLGSAMIEAKKQQELYVVGDALPANGKVTLAKIFTQAGGY